VFRAVLIAAVIELVIAAAIVTACVVFR